MQKITSKTKYIMPKCPICDKRFKLVRKDCMAMYFTSVDKNGKRHREEYLSTGNKFCKKCKEDFDRLGPKKFLDLVTFTIFD